ncbi:hypothetical protein PSV08DRAFT_348778 [Bipolaris maydis]|uniref:uncharacterized protein n=1 Tax=Cochliobolus heterostrophus TaxID=5016 RepID=UPI0024D9AA4D|nr:hypothetical protein PSV08DRAFT_348778 [Bipolaris maydis]KAJ6284983.1 hypothetical protein J3E71DRAFT_339356 [Bipolaris maydis]
MQSDQDLNGDSSGGTSRASNVPAASRTSGRTPGRVSNSGFSAPVCHAVSSMLHTETETGSVGNVPIDGLSDIDNTHRQTQRHRESSKMLTTLPSSNTSGIHSGQSHRYSSSSSIPRYPTASNRSHVIAARYTERPTPRPATFAIDGTWHAASQWLFE